MVKYCRLWFSSPLRTLVQNQEMLVGYKNMVSLEIASPLPIKSSLHRGFMQHVIWIQNIPFPHKRKFIEVCNYENCVPIKKCEPVDIVS